MAILNPEHLLEQAGNLVPAGQKGKPRQANLRRAVSTAYYSVFHQILIAAADEFVGKSQRNESRYSLVYRSIDHATVRRTCEEAARTRPSARYRKYLPQGSFDPKIRGFANSVLSLQAKRHEADYDPSCLLTVVDVLFAMHLAGSAMRLFEGATHDDRKTFLTLLLFAPR